MSSVKEIQSVHNACRVIEAIASVQPVGVSDLARLTGIEKSATHRLAVTLYTAGWLTRSDDGRWRIAPSLVSMIRTSATTSLVTGVRPLLEAARNQSGETAMLVVPDTDRLVIADAAESAHNLRVSVTVGSPMPKPRSSAALRVIAAYLSPDQLDRWRRIDPNLTDKALRAIRERGWSLNDGEVDDQTRAVGAALRHQGGDPVAALVLVGPISRIRRDAMPELGELVARLAASWSGA